MEISIDNAVALYRAYKLEESREMLELIVKQDPKNVEALLVLGKIHSRTQNYGVAINYFNQVLKLDNDNNAAKTGLKLIKNILQLTNNFYFENAYTQDNLYDFE